jgi:hypothetical protein
MDEYLSHQALQRSSKEDSSVWHSWGSQTDETLNKNWDHEEGWEGRVQHITKYKTGSCSREQEECRSIRAEWWV